MWWDVYYPQGKYNSTSEISVLPFNKLAACCFQIFISYKEILSRKEDPTKVSQIAIAFYYIIYKMKEPRTAFTITYNV